MGAWGIDIAESDDTYDLLDEIEGRVNFDPFDIVHGREYDREAAAKSLLENSEAIEQLIEDQEEDYFGIWGILYTAILINTGITPNDKQKDLFYRAFKVEKDKALMWDLPDQRHINIERVKVALEENIPYEFGSLGLLDTFIKERAEGKTGLINK